jgi:cell division protein FtsI/penicillin-binding protein 2
VDDPVAVAEGLDFSVLPDELRHLSPLISRYAESDDVDRSELLEQASDEELRELSEAPEAHWEAINTFLDQHVEAESGSSQDVALALDSFAQAAMEAKLELATRVDR